MKVPLFINMGTFIDPVRYDLRDHPEASVYLGVMEPNQPFEEAVIKKKYTGKSETTFNGDVLVGLDAIDTEYILPGKYFYQVKIRIKDEHEDSVETIVPKTEFFVME